MKGQDGRLYVGSGHAKAEDRTYTDSPDNIYPSKSAYPVASPQHIVKSRHKTSLSMSVHNGAQMFATKSGPHLLNDDSVQLNFKSKANIFGTIIEDRYKRDTKLKQSLRNSIIDRSSNKFLTAETSKNVESKQRMYTNISAASGHRKKLPIGFLIQQERKGEYAVSNSQTPDLRMNTKEDTLPMRSLRPMTGKVTVINKSIEY